MQNCNYSKKAYYTVILKIIIFLVLYTAISIMVIYVCYRNDDEKVFSALEYNSAPVVIIDAGHGGIDGGAVSESGVIEKDVNLKIAKYLEELFILSDIECVMTRTDDVELTPSDSYSSSRKRRDLLARIEIANSYDNALFISIHQNTYPSSRLSGLQVFYSKNNNMSKILADTIKTQNSILIDGDNKRAVKPAGREILILDSINIPAVLIECGFLSNAKEAAMLSEDEYQKKLSFMIFTSINEYIKNNFS